MLLMTEATSILLEILNDRQEPIARSAAWLQSLHGDCATLTLQLERPPACLRWGAQARFRFREGTRSYEALGMIVAREAANNAPFASASHPLPLDQPPPSDRQRMAVWEITIRLWRCQPVAERRAAPRVWTRFGVEFAVVSTPSDDPRAILSGADRDAAGLAARLGGGPQRGRHAPALAYASYRGRASEPALCAAGARRDSERPAAERPGAAHASGRANAALRAYTRAG